jgi:hypothetical protein
VNERTAIFAANWKMNKMLSEVEGYVVTGAKPRLKKEAGVLHSRYFLFLSTHPVLRIC